MIARTWTRIADDPRFDAPLIVSSATHEAKLGAIFAELGELNPKETKFLLEPVARNSAPALALAAEWVARTRPDACLLVMPSDHEISDRDAFLRALTAVEPAVRSGALATLGIAPTGPETGFGYIQLGDPISESVHRIRTFVEKPDSARARAMLASGQYVWNSGIFVMRADAYLAALAHHAPAIAAAARAAIAQARTDGQHIWPDMEAFAACPSDSIDYAVMEKVDNAVVTPVTMGWSDVGSWDAVADLSATAPGESVTQGEVEALDTENCLFWGQGARIAAVGVRDLIVISHEDQVLIVPRHQSQRVRELVEALRRRHADPSHSGSI